MKKQIHNMHIVLKKIYNINKKFLIFNYLYLIFALLFSILMGRLLAFDYGKKRTGIAVSDPLKIIASGLTTVDTNKLFDFISDYIAKEDVDCFIVGFPTQLDNSAPSHSLPLIKEFIEKLSKKYPNIPIELEDEHFTSKIAVKTMIDGGLKKMQRRNKAMIDKISASIILRSYMDTKQN